MTSLVPRNLNRRAFTQMAGGWLVLGGTPALAQGRSLPLSQAINRAGKLRALSQRQSKAYAQAALGVLPEKAQDIMAATQHQLSSSLAELAGAGGPADTKALLGAVDRDHRALATAMRARAAKDTVLEVARAADLLLESANRLTQAFEEQSQQGSARIVNVAGRQRMLSQRAARAYFLVAAGHDSQAVRGQLAAARAEFTQGLATLQAAPIATPAIRNELDLARSQWLFYDSALGRASGTETLQMVATTSERVFEVMDNLTALYEAALRDLL